MQWGSRLVFVPSVCFTKTCDLLLAKPTHLLAQLYFSPTYLPDSTKVSLQCVQDMFSSMASLLSCFRAVESWVVWSWGVHLLEVQEDFLILRTTFAQNLAAICKWIQMDWYQPRQEAFLRAEEELLRFQTATSLCNVVPKHYSTGCSCLPIMTESGCSKNIICQHLPCSSFASTPEKCPRWPRNLEAESIDSIDAFLIRKGTDIACIKIWDCKYVVHHKIQKGIWEAARQMIPNICKWQKKTVSTCSFFLSVFFGMKLLNFSKYTLPGCNSN